MQISQPFWKGLVLGPYSPTILKNVICLIRQMFLYLEPFECNTASDWLTHTGYFLYLEPFECNTASDWLTHTGYFLYLEPFECNTASDWL